MTIENFKNLLREVFPRLAILAHCAGERLFGGTARTLERLVALGGQDRFPVRVRRKLADEGNAEVDVFLLPLRANAPPPRLARRSVTPDDDLQSHLSFTFHRESRFAVGVALRLACLHPLPTIDSISQKGAKAQGGKWVISWVISKRAT